MRVNKCVSLINDAENNYDLYYYNSLLYRRKTLNFLAAEVIIHFLKDT